MIFHVLNYILRLCMCDYVLRYYILQCTKNKKEQERIRDK